MVIDGTCSKALKDVPRCHHIFQMEDPKVRGWRRLALLPGKGKRAYLAMWVKLPRPLAWLWPGPQLGPRRPSGSPSGSAS